MEHNNCILFGIHGWPPDDVVTLIICNIDDFAYVYKLPISHGVLTPLLQRQPTTFPAHAIAPVIRTLHTSHESSGR